MSALDVVITSMEPRIVLSARRRKAHTPLQAEAWKRALNDSNLTHLYPTLVQDITFGFNIGFPPIISTFAPPNSSTLNANKDAFNSILSRELDTRRYIGPLSQTEVEDLIGPFQSSPLSMIPKPHKPDKFRLIQNFSYPHSPREGRASMNSHVNSDEYPCTWGTFTAVALLLSQLPEGSQIAVRDVAEAYRTIPLHWSQWPGTVVRVSNEDAFCIDTSASFGGAANCGVYGRCADAACDIMRARGIGPIIKWVDDHLFIRIRSDKINEYNRKRGQWRQNIQELGGRHQSGGRVWYGGKTLQDGRTEEFVEDMQFPLQILEGGEFSYSLEDVNKISSELGIPWETQKDRDFADEALFTGMLWSVKSYTVALAETKRLKYLAAVEDWTRKETHTLEDVQKLHGKLIHASLVAPEGRAYLTCLERMLGIFHDAPFKPRHAPRGTDFEISWWRRRLSSFPIERPIPGPVSVLSLDAFSDASSTVGVGICFKGRWRAWALADGWKQVGREQRDIGWAEAVGFEVLIHAIASSHPQHNHLRVYGDNQGVVEGWRNGRSRNVAVNEVFRRIHKFTQEKDLHFYASYVQSAHNPADGPSRGVYPPSDLRLDPFEIPSALDGILLDTDSQPIDTKHATDKTKSAREHTSTERERLDAAQQEREVFQAICREDQCSSVRG